MIHNLPDVTPNGTPTPLAPVRTPCNWVQVNAASGNSNPVRIGDSTTGPASGLQIFAGGGQFFPAISDTLYLDLNMVYVYGTGADSVSIVFGRH